MRKVVGWLVIAFLVFYLVSQPVAAANAVKSAGNGVVAAGHQLARFLTSLSK